MRPAPCTKLCTATGHVDAGYNRLGVINPCSATSRLVSGHPCNVPLAGFAPAPSNRAALVRADALLIEPQGTVRSTSSSASPRTAGEAATKPASLTESGEAKRVATDSAGATCQTCRRPCTVTRKRETPKRQQSLAQVHPHSVDEVRNSEITTSQPLPHVVHQGGHPLNILGCPPPQPPNTNNSNCPLLHHCLGLRPKLLYPRPGP